MTPIVAWLVGSSTGRWVAIALLVAAILGFVALRLIGIGRQREQAERTEEALGHVLDRIEVDQEIRRMPVSERRKLLRTLAVDAR